jgi:NAD(P)-dependent dehydrogenase (short-subunit alcohol dehydrogenase family)
MPGWTAADIPDLGGRTAVVTGATSGLGLVTARELHRDGADVTLAVRDLPRGAAVAREIAGGREPPETMALDLADLGSVRAFAAAYAERHQRLELLVNNAGVMGLPHRRSADGFELQMATNHLGPFALTGLLLPALLAAPEARVVPVSSLAHRFGRLSAGVLAGEGRYRRWQAYSATKLANLRFAFELQRRADLAGVPLLSVAAHPGWVGTNLLLAGPRMESSAAKLRLAWIATRLIQGADMGALPILFAATMPALPRGAFVGPDGPGETRGHPRLVAASAAARDRSAARRLWAASEQLTGVRFGFPAPL